MCHLQPCLAQVNVIEDNPYKVHTIIQLKLADFECGMSDVLRYNVGIQGDYFFRKFASVHAAWQTSAYSTIISSDATLYDNENKNLSPFKMYEVGGRLHIIDKESTFSPKGYLGSSGVYSYWSIMNGVPIRKVFALRGGVYGTIVPVSSSWSTLKNGIAGGIVVADGSTIGRFTELFTNMRTSGIYGGLSWGQFANVKYKSHGKTWVSKFFKEIYFDVLYTTSPEFDRFVENQIEYEVKPNMDGSFRTSNIGWRCGVYRVRSKSKVSVAFGLEAGARPGVFFRGGYFSSSISLSFSS
jgi:hypothetical protein